MLSREDAIAKFIDEYDIDVPQDKVDEKYEILLRDYRRRALYSNMYGGISLDPIDMNELPVSIKDKIKKEAILKVKEDIVYDKVLSECNFSVTDDELIEYVNSKERLEKSSVDTLKDFFADDMAALKAIIRRKKAEDWMVEQIEVS